MNTRTRNRNRPSGAGGWLLIETLILLGLLGVFMLLASRLFIGIARIEHDTRHSQMLATRFDTMLWRLRRDVWRSTDIHADNDTLVLTLPKGERITWRFDDPVVREAPGGVRDWTKLTPTLTIAAPGSPGTPGAPGRVTLDVSADPAANRPTRFTLVSQLMLREAEK